MSNKYLTYAEARIAARRLGLESIRAYRKGYHKDPWLPSDPTRIYGADWVDWYDFLGTTKPEVPYATYAEASAAAQRLGFGSIIAYRQGYSKDPKLPSSPHQVYSGSWVDWFDFLGTTRPGVKFYTTYAEARVAVQRLRLESISAYKQGYQKDPKLPSSPHQVYGGSWVDWYDFLGTPRPAEKFYTDYAEARAAAQRLGFDGIKVYKRGYHKDPQLPSDPNRVYSAEWVDWCDFLGARRSGEKFYATYAAARAAAQRLGFDGSRVYKQGYKQDPGLPSDPQKTYSADWVDWYDFLAITKPEKLYGTYAEARAAAQRLGLLEAKAYRKGHRKDPRLPSAPNWSYSADWIDWYDFLGVTRPAEKFYTDYDEARAAAQRVGFDDSKMYKRGYHKDPRLPSDPTRIYGADWVDWYDFLGTTKPEEPYDTYAEASAAVRRLGFDTIRAYRQGYLQDPRLPSSPHRVYSASWVDWYHFLGTKDAFDPGSYPDLLRAIDKYIELGTNQVAKKSHLMAFAREVVASQALSGEPGALLARDIPFPNRAYEDFVYATGEMSQRPRHNICVNFFDWLLDTYCSDEDDEGILTPMPGFRNPLRTILKGFLDQLPTARPSESDKPVLSLKSVLRAKNHLIPSNAQTFSDLYRLHSFLGDCWTEIDPSLVDENDPNCVTRTVSKDRKPRAGERYREEITEIWSPVKLVANYCLFSMPLRGQQILWLDSGEGDEIIPVWQNGRATWIKNPSPLARPKRKQGFLQQGEDGESSSFITTNKTGRRDGSYRVPFMPDTLAYWVIQLREWQSKYNPITELTPWTKIKLRQRINKDVLRRRGQQAFLFRDPGSVVCDDKVSPMFTTTAFRRTLPAILFHSQEPGEDLAVHQPAQRSDKYSSQFTPHSLRVSLITAYVVDGAAPLAVISKLVGHASLVMTIYYTKVGHAKMRQALNDAEKTAVAQNVDRIHDLILQKKIDEARPELIATDRASIGQFISPEWPASAFQIMNIGICPMGGAACDEGGDLLIKRATEKIYSPVPNGYLGARNCPRCRFFISGPAFLGGLSAISNEVILEINITRREYHECETQMQELEDERFDLESSGLPFKKQLKLKHVTSAFEEKAKKLDVLATDFQHLYRLISQSTELLNANGSNKKQLIISDQYVEIGMQLVEQQTEFRLLAEVCTNAEIYTSSSASRALPLLTQMLDKLADSNGMAPSLFRLTEDQQLKAANQVVSLIMQTTHHNWHTADQLINGQILLEDLGAEPEVRRLQKEIQLIMRGSLSLSLPQEA